MYHITYLSGCLLQQWCVICFRQMSQTKAGYIFDKFWIHRSLPCHAASSRISYVFWSENNFCVRRAGWFSLSGIYRSVSRDIHSTHLWVTVSALTSRAYSVRVQCYIHWTLCILGWFVILDGRSINTTVVYPWWDISHSSAVSTTTTACTTRRIYIQSTTLPVACTNIGVSFLWCVSVNVLSTWRGWYNKIPHPRQRHDISSYHTVIYWVIYVAISWSFESDTWQCECVRLTNRNVYAWRYLM